MHLHDNACERQREKGSDRESVLLCVCVCVRLCEWTSELAFMQLSSGVKGLFS